MSHSPENPQPESSEGSQDSTGSYEQYNFSSYIDSSDKERSKTNLAALEITNGQLISAQHAAEKLGINNEDILDNKIDGLTELYQLTQDLAHDKRRQLSVSETEFIDYMSSVIRLTEARALISQDKLVEAFNGAEYPYKDKKTESRVASPEEALIFEFGRRKQTSETAAKSAQRMINNGEGENSKRDLSLDVQRNLARKYIFNQAERFALTRLDPKKQPFSGKQFIGRFDSESYKPENDEAAIDLLRDTAYRNDVETYALIAIARDKTPMFDIRRDDHFCSSEQKAFRERFENDVIAKRIPKPSSKNLEDTGEKEAAKESRDDTKTDHDSGNEDLVPTSDTQQREPQPDHDPDDVIDSDDATAAQHATEFDRMAVEAEREAAVQNYQDALRHYAQRKNSKIDNDDDRTMWQQAIHRLMLTDPKFNQLLSEESDARPEVKQALINKYYVDKFSDLRKASLEDQVKSHEKSFAATILRHKKFIKIGGYLLATVSAITGNVPAAVFFSAATKATLSGAEYYDKKAKQSFAADNGEAGSLSFINSQKSLDSLKALGNTSGLDIADSAFQILMKEHDEVYMRAVDKARNERLTKSLGVSAAWFTGIMLGGNLGADMLSQFYDYQMHGSGGWMDKINHLSNPAGETPWTADPSAVKPWWLNSYAPMVAAAIGGTGALSVATYMNRRKATPPNTHQSGRHRQEQPSQPRAYADLGTRAA